MTIVTGGGDFTLNASSKAMTVTFHTLSNSITFHHLTIRHYVSVPENIVNPYRTNVENKVSS